MVVLEEPDLTGPDALTRETQTAGLIKMPVTSMVFARSAVVNNDVFGCRPVIYDRDDGVLVQPGLDRQHLVHVTCAVVVVCQVVTLERLVGLADDSGFG